MWRRHERDGRGVGRCRPGMATGDAVLLCASLALVGGLGAIVVPQALEASSGEREFVVEAPAEGSCRESFDRVRLLFEGCAGVIGVWERDAGAGGVEVALWHRDTHEPWVVNTDEVLVLSFSRTLGALVAYLERPAEEEPGLEVVGESSGEAGLGEGVSPGDLVRGDFCRWFRARPRTERRVIVGGLRDVRVERGDGGEGLETLRVELVWGSGETDGGGEKGVFEVAVGRTGT